MSRPSLFHRHAEEGAHQRRAAVVAQALVAGLDVLQVHREAALGDAADRAGPAVEGALGDVVAVGHQLGDAQLAGGLVGEQQDAGVQVQGAVQQRQGVEELVVHLLDARSQEPLVVGRRALRRSRDQAEHARLELGLLLLLVELLAGALPHPGDLHPREQEVEQPEEHDEGRVQGEGLRVLPALGEEVEQRLEAHRREHEHGAHGLAREGGEERDQHVDEGVEGPGQPAADLHPGVDGDQQEQAELQVQPAGALAQLLLAEAHERPGGQHGEPDAADHRMLQPQLGDLDPEHADDVEQGEGQRRHEAVGAPHRLSHRQRRVYQRRHRTHD